MKYTLYALFFLPIVLSPLNSTAQYQMLVELNEGGSDAFPVADIRSIKFSDSTMMVNQYSGDVAIFSIGDIARYRFMMSSGVLTDTKADNSGLLIYPNPVDELLEISYTSHAPGNVVIELTDLLGRPLALVYSGFHMGTQSYRYSMKLPSGTYMCRISSEQETIYKPFMVK